VYNASITRENKMPDGLKRKRRNKTEARRKWYAKHRQIRFTKRFGLK
jgi:hypothetical protein